MTRKYFRITEVVELCGVNKGFILRLERERLIRPLPSQKRKLYSLDQVERVRVARLLIEDMGVNIEGAEVALNMREQMMAMQRQLKRLVRRLNAHKSAGRGQRRL
jgi:MerR family transcriptional regulator/heat shock protein HspR